MQLWRAHGLGNDYLVLEDGPVLTPHLVRQICDRHRGVGGDGVLEPTDGGPCEHGVRIWNPDGSVAEKSGNGLRIFARWLVDACGAPAHFTVNTGSDAVSCEVQDDHIAIEMGHATTEPSLVPVQSDAPVIDTPWRVGGTELRLTALATGNPHVVTFVDQDLDTVPWRHWGQVLETDPRFPQRTNVQIARVLGSHAIEIRIWERGAGPTLASGSSSCAAATAAVLTGRLGHGRITVHMPGGVLHVTVRPDLSLRLEGPVEPVGRIQVDARWLAAHSG